MDYVFYYFLKKTRSGISCELSARQTIQIHCQFLFFLTNTTKCRRQKLWLALKRSYVTRYRLYWLDKWRNKRYIYIVPSKWSGWVTNIRHFLENGSGVLFFSFKNSKFTWTNTFTLEFVRWTLSTFYLYTSIVEDRYVNNIKKKQNGKQCSSWWDTNNHSLYRHLTQRQNSL